MKKMVFLVGITAFFLSVGVASGAVVDITDVQISPSEPTEFEVIEISTFMWFEHGVLATLHANYTQVGNSLELDLGFYVHSDPPSSLLSIVEIGILEAGSYDLTVYTSWTDPIEPGPMISSDTYTTSFVVTPEPATLCLLGLGGLMLRRRKSA
jgi:hypothetical protein